MSVHTIENLTKGKNFNKQRKKIITKDKFKLLLEKCGEAKWDMEDYLEYYDCNPNIVYIWIYDNNLITDKPFIEKQEYELMMRKKKLSENFITQNLLDYDIDPKLAQLWIPYNSNKSFCVIL